MFYSYNVFKYVLISSGVFAFFFFLFHVLAVFVLAPSSSGGWFWRSNELTGVEHWEQRAVPGQPSVHQTPTITV